MTILGVDIGTTGLKMGVFDAAADSLKLIGTYSESYEINVYNKGLFGDIEPEKWRRAFSSGCRTLNELVADVDVVALAGTTPGLTAMDGRGEALYPAILMLDQRSRKQAQLIIDTIGVKQLLESTGNVPVAGGCSLASILWIRDNLPEVYNRTAVFGHSNTYMAKWLTGGFAMDPSSASLTSLYNTARCEFSWDQDLADAFDISLSRLPAILPAYESAGKISSSLAERLGLYKEPPVLIGGNDAVLAAYSAGIDTPGEIINVNGTSEITLICLSECLPSVNYNVRAHVLPNRWLTLHVMNAGGKALEWFRSLFCRELDSARFFDDYLPRAIDNWLERDSSVTYVPYLMGSRYSQKPLKAEFVGLTQTTTREEMLAALVRGLCRYQQKHLEEVGRKLKLSDTVHVTGGAVNAAVIRAKRKWMSSAGYIHSEQSTMKGAAMMGLRFLQN